MDLSEVYFVGGDLSDWLTLFRQMSVPRSGHLLSNV